VRAFLLALGVALFVWIGWSSPAPAQEASAVDAVVEGDVTAAEHEVSEGYFAIGQETTLVAKPGSDLHAWLSRHNGRRVVIRLESDPD
jgi:hypothetical protein